jgi:hypothetical protein
MIMEPMAGITAENREREERGKFRAGLKSGRATGSQGMKRKREDGEDGDTEGAAKRKKSYGKGPKGPNPLAVKKSKRRVEGEVVKASPKADSKVQNGKPIESAMIDAASETGIKRKRRRKHKSGVGEWDTVTAEEEHMGSSEGRSMRWSFVAEHRLRSQCNDTPGRITPLFYSVQLQRFTISVLVPILGQGPCY